MRRGELYRVHQPPGDPKEHRIFVLLSRQWVIETRFSTLICAPVFSNGQGLATQVSVGIDEGMKRESWILCDGLTSVRRAELTQYVGSLSRTKLSEVDRAIAIALDLRF
jgi:mRNA interferase MazF